MATQAVTAKAGSAVPIHTARAPRTNSTPPAAPDADTMPRSGLGRWRTFGRFVGVSREKWRQLVLEGKAPQPIRMGVRCSLYEYAQIHEWLADPLNYRVASANGATEAD
jgi:prophage regulatory protein